MESERGIELADLLSRLSAGVAELFPDRVWVRAEISSLQARGNGHCYLELSQSDDGGVVAKARAVIWRSRFAVLGAYFADETGSPLQAGISVLVRAQVTCSELYGVTLVIDDIQPAFTLGEAELRRRHTIEELTAAGMMDRQKTLSPSPLPYRLAVVSASDAAGYGDFCRHLQDNGFGFAFEVELFPAAMQGQNAPQSIAEALETIESSGTVYDAVLIIRGGGSVLDLACFDDYDLCFAIANCGIPVYTAIGHDRDFHVADMVAFGYVKTPTALSDLFISTLAVEDERLTSFSSRLSLAISNKISAMESRVETLRERILAADPRNVLKRGYSLVTDERGVVVKSASALHRGGKFKIMFSDGEAGVTVDWNNYEKI